MSEFSFISIESEEKDGGQRTEASVVASACDVDSLIDEFSLIMAQAKGIDTSDPLEAEAKLLELLSEGDLNDARCDYLLNRLTTAVVKDLEFDTVLAPGVHAEVIPERGKGFSFEINLIPRPQVTLSSTDPVTVTFAPVEVEEADIEAQIAYTADQFTGCFPIDRSELQVGDYALIDIEMTKNGKLEKEYSGLRRLIEVQRGLLPDAFIEGLTGMKTGEIRKVEFTLPCAMEGEDETACAVDSYCADVMLRELQEKIVPTIDDEWVAENLPQFGNLQGFRDYIRSDFESQGARVSQQDIVYRARAVLEKRLEGTIPDEMYQEAKDSLMRTVMKRIDDQGMTLEEYLDEHEMTSDVFNMNIFMQAAELLRQNLALDVLARERGFTETDEEVNQARERLGGTMARLTDDEFEKRGLRKTLGEQIRREKAMSWLMDTMVVDGAGAA